jgi:hypothetical protein
MGGGMKRNRDGSVIEDSDGKRPKSSDGGETAKLRMLHQTMSDPTPFSLQRGTSGDEDDFSEPPPSHQPQHSNPDTQTDQPTPKSEPDKPPQIFRGLTMYLNGSTMPLISDHKLKQIFAQHGGQTSISLSRRTVTRVILGDTSSGGGGLSGRKIQKEVALVRGKGVKYVSVQWVLDSVERGVRQSEGRYVPEGWEGRLGGSRQGSVRRCFEVKDWA